MSMLHCELFILVDQNSVPDMGRTAQIALMNLGYRTQPTTMTIQAGTWVRLVYGTDADPRQGHVATAFATAEKARDQALGAVRPSADAELVYRFNCIPQSPEPRPTSGPDRTGCRV